MMILDHISIYTEDLEQLKQFYVHFFSGISNEKYFNPKTGLETYFISFSSGARLELMRRPGVGERGRTVLACGLSHLAFRVEDRKIVDELTRSIIDAGYSLKSGPRVTGDGYYESCILDPDGNEVEITA